jgi:hypothetical protein
MTAGNLILSRSSIFGTGSGVYGRAIQVERIEDEVTIWL